MKRIWNFVKKIFPWRILSYICAGVALFLIINFSVLASYVKTQRSSEQEQIRTEQQIGKQLIDREITKLEKERQEAELQRQTEERVRVEKEAEEAEAEAQAKIARRAKEQEEERKHQQQVLAAQQAEAEKEAKRQVEAEKKATEEAQRLTEEQRKEEETQLKIEKCKAETQLSFDKFKVNMNYIQEEAEKTLKPKELEILDAKGDCAKKSYEPLPERLQGFPFSPSQLRDIRQSEYDTCMVAVYSSEELLQAIKDKAEETVVKTEQEAKALSDKQYLECLNK